MLFRSKNYGWPEIRGDETREGMVPPIINAGASETWAPAGATFVSRGPWAGSLLFTGLRGQTLYRVVLDPNDPRKVDKFERLLYRQFGRLRDIVEVPMETCIFSPAIAMAAVAQKMTMTE